MSCGVEDSAITVRHKVVSVAGLGMIRRKIYLRVHLNSPAPSTREHITSRLFGCLVHGGRYMYSTVMDDPPTPAARLLAVLGA